MKKGYIIAIVLGGLVLAGGVLWAGLSWANTSNAMGQYKNQLNNIYQRNLYELTDDVNNMESNLGKLKVSTNSETQQRYLTNLVAEASSASENVTTLPIQHTSISDTINFLNQLNGYCVTLQAKLVAGNELTLDDMDQIDNLHQSSKTIKYELNRLTVLVNGGFSIVDNASNPNDNNSGFNAEFNSLNNEIIDYPTLIYDGPFSDSTTNKAIKGLPEAEVNIEQAKQKLVTWFPNYQIEENGQTNKGKFDTYNFILTNGNLEYYAQITKRGGILLQLNASYEVGEKTKSEAECCTIAENFAQQLGFDNMKTVWSAESNGFIYANLAPVQNEVILYPDIIKIKVAQDIGDVIGWEAKSYAYNHITRTNLSPIITEIDARAVVGDEMDIRSCQLALIPGQYVGEILTYEFMCINDGSTYYVYIDAKTNLQVNVLKVIETDDGNLIM